MGLQKYRDSYDVFSSKASEIARQLAFAGIAAVWVLRPADPRATEIPDALLVPLAAFVTALGLDLLHAAYGALAWGAFCRYHEHCDTDPASDIDAPKWINWPTNSFFVGKIAAVLVGYAATFDYVLSQMS
jgi:hypothetical protein